MSEPAPLYQRVKAHILDNIRKGAWAPGARVPSENELVEHFRISRMTANRALKELTADGILARVPGVGTFVKEPQARSSLMELRNIADEIRARGHVHSARVELAETIIASPALAEAFEVPASQRLYHVVIVHKANGIPVQLEDRYVNPVMVREFLGQDFTKTTPTAYLIATVPADDLEHTVSAVMPARDHQRLLDISAGEPCLSLHRRSWSSGIVVTVVTLLYPGSRYALQSRHKTSPSGTINGRS